MHRQDKTSCFFFSSFVLNCFHSSSNGWECYCAHTPAAFPTLSCIRVKFQVCESPLGPQTYGVIIKPYIPKFLQEAISVQTVSMSFSFHILSQFWFYLTKGSMFYRFMYVYHGWKYIHVQYSICGSHKLHAHNFQIIHICCLSAKEYPITLMHRVVHTKRTRNAVGLRRIPFPLPCVFRYGRGIRCLPSSARTDDPIEERKTETIRSESFGFFLKMLLSEWKFYKCVFQ